MSKHPSSSWLFKGNQEASRQEEAANSTLAAQPADDGDVPVQDVEAQDEVDGSIVPFFLKLVVFLSKQSVS